MLNALGSKVGAGIGAAAVATGGLIVLGTSVADSITAVFTAVAGVAAAVAALASRDAARDSRRALGLHYEPTLSFMAQPESFGIDYDPPPVAPEPVSVRVESSDPRAGVRLVTADWTLLDGRSGRTHLEVGQSTPIPGLQTTERHQHSGLWFVNLAQLTLSCRDDRAPFVTWTAVLTAAPGAPGAMVGGTAHQPLFRPAD